MGNAGLLSFKVAQIKNLLSVKFYLPVRATLFTSGDEPKLVQSYNLTNIIKPINQIDIRKLKILETLHQMEAQIYMLTTLAISIRVKIHK